MRAVLKEQPVTVQLLGMPHDHISLATLGHGVNAELALLTLQVLLERQAMAVLRIQAMWRGHAARQSLSKEKKGKGATKGKGAAKKKK